VNEAYSKAEQLLKDNRSKLDKVKHQPQEILAVNEIMLLH